MGIVQHDATVRVIVPARNEEECLGRCLESLVSQQGIEFQVTVVDDGSTDRTKEIAESFTGVHVLNAPLPAPGVSGKSNALIFAVETENASSQPEGAADVPWLLFTDADTLHLPDSLARAVAEAEERQVDLLSYSPEQETVTWSERVLMPLVFSELTRAYPSERVNDPDDPVVAANGQFILVRRTVYESLGGHRAIAGKLLEDVELARLFKSAGFRIWFRYGHGMVRTRMYRDFRSLAEGWTKNLALLFRHPLRMAALRSAEFVALFGALFVAGVLIGEQIWIPALWMLVVFALLLGRFLVRVRASNFSWNATLGSAPGLPLFAVLLLRSSLHLRVGHRVSWKGRYYQHSEPPVVVDSSIQKQISG